ncbi:MAG: UDP-N-acetylmuramate dehydrogenase [Chloroflexi bacterium]|nr:UDP-N-acetylmuramate dehydrogenase [Chloroflexota bacterium]
MTMTALPLDALRQTFGARLQENVPLARFTSARMGGPAETLLEAESADDLAEIVSRLWGLDISFRLLGGGSNILVSDRGVRGVVVHNRARAVEWFPERRPPQVRAESGANFGALARQAAQKGLSGLEWAAGIPGTVGGAVYGNAGAHGGDMAANLRLAEVLHRHTGRQKWKMEDLRYSYRSSILKENLGQAVVLAATLDLARSQPAEIEQKMDEYLVHRRRTQPPGASLGSMFKNPPGDYAGRLIEAAGLKGLRVGDVQVSDLHGNFFVNLGEGSAADAYTLIQQTRAQVEEKTGVRLELEVELVGDWQGEARP